jgi:hypothetical protein
MDRRPMIELAYNRSLHLLCARAGGGQVPADNERLIAAVAQLDRDGQADRQAVAFLLDLAPDAEAPDAYWRRRFAEQRKAAAAPRVFNAVVTTSRLLRGVLTAMNWVSPEPAHVKSVHHATWDEAAAWIELVQGTPVGATRSLFGRVERAAPASAG